MIADVRTAVEHAFKAEAMISLLDLASLMFHLIRQSAPERRGTMTAACIYVYDEYRTDARFPEASA